MEISSAEKICLNARYRSSDLLVKRLAERSADEDLLKTMEDYTKKYRYGLQCGMVEYKIGKK